MTPMIVRAFIIVLICLETEGVYANIVGPGTQNFNPTTDGLDYVTVQSSKTLKPGIFNLGAFYNYAVNSLPYVDSTVQSRTKLNDSLSSMDFSLGVGLLPYLSVGISVPFVISQSVEEQAGVRAQFAKNGVTEFRLNTKLRFAGNATTGFAAIASLNIPRTVNDPFAGVNPGPTYNIEFIADHAFSKLHSAALNIGYRFRNPGSKVPGTFIEPMRNQLIVSTAMSYLFEKIDTKMIGEIFGSIPAQSEGTNESRNTTSAELLLGLKHDWTSQLAVHGGLGTELLQGISSPDYRIYAGLNYTFGPVWAKNVAVMQQLPVESPKKRKIKKFSIGTVLFEFDSDVLVKGNEKVLADLVTELKRIDFETLSIAGHTDSVGSVAYNNNLSLRRANSIRNYLVEKAGIKDKKIETEGFGPSQPIASNANYQGCLENRRVEFTIEY